MEKSELCIWVLVLLLFLLAGEMMMFGVSFALMILFLALSIKDDGERDGVEKRKP